MGEKAGNRSNTPYNELIRKKYEQIDTETGYPIPLVGPKESLSTLESEYFNEAIYGSKVQNLCTKYDSIRRVRADGNCFYRSFGFAFLEQLIDKKEKYESFREFAKQSKEKLLTLNFPRFSLEDVHEEFMEIVNMIGRGGSEAKQQLYAMFNELIYSNCIVLFLRMLVSGHIQEKEQFYGNFLEGNRSVMAFCKEEVEPMNKESDHIHIVALTSELNVTVRVKYMDRGKATEMTTHDFPEGASSNIHVHLLYRPGHYDILYPRVPNVAGIAASHAEPE